MAKKIMILDCDPGIDDAFAIFYAMAEARIDLRLITTVSGNVSVDKTTLNARRLVAMGNRNIEIAQGARVPLVAPPFFADDVHGSNGMGDYDFPPDEVLAPLSSRDAISAMFDVLNNANEKVVIAAVGPLTNIAKLLMLHPEVKNKIEYLTIMGGGLKGGNTTPAAEFNFYVDPEAAAYVFQAGIPIIMAGLDVTEKAVIHLEQMDELAKLSKVGKFLSDVVKKMNNDKNLHDVISVMAVCELADFKYEELHVSIETQGVYCRGFSLADQRFFNRKKPNAKVLLDLDHGIFLDKLFSKISTYE